MGAQIEKETIPAMVVGRRRCCFSAMKLLLLASCLLWTDATHLRATRELQDTVIQSFDVNLILALHFVGDSTASALETKDKTNGVVEHFCNNVQEQVSNNRCKADVVVAVRSIGI